MRLAVLGCGNMGSAIIKGVQSSNPQWEIMVYDSYLPSAQKIEGVEVLPLSDWFSNDRDPDVVLIAVKPQILEEALEPFSKIVSTTLWVSIVAGKSISTLESTLPNGSKVCRVMPNTPALIGESMSAFTLNHDCSEIDRETVTLLLSSFGEVIEVKESQMNAITGLSGSGPAYVYTIIEALAEGGVVAGLPYDVAIKAAAQTVKGAAQMVINTGDMPAVLKSRVMSPGGTTAAGIKSLEEGGVRGALMNAVVSAKDRADELA